MGAHQISQLLGDYGLGLVFTVVALQALGAPLPGTTVLIAAAVYAAAGHGLPIAGVIAAGALGALVGTSIAFAVGRLRGAAVLYWAARRLHRDPAHVDVLRTQFARRGAVWLFIGRFISGVRNLIGLLAGASGMGWWRFCVVSALAATAWASINGLEYYWFGRALASAATWLQVVLVCAGIAWLVLSLRLLRRRALRELGELGEVTGAE